MIRKLAVEFLGTGVLAAGLHRLLYREEDIRLAAEAQQPDQAAASNPAST